MAATPLSQTPPRPEHAEIKLRRGNSAESKYRRGQIPSMPSASPYGIESQIDVISDQLRTQERHG